MGCNLFIVRGTFRATSWRVFESLTYPSRWRDTAPRAPSTVAPRSPPKSAARTDENLPVVSAIVAASAVRSYNYGMRLAACAAVVARGSRVAGRARRARAQGGVLRVGLPCAARLARSRDRLVDASAALLARQVFDTLRAVPRRRAATSSRASPRSGRCRATAWPGPSGCARACASTTATPLAAAARRDEPRARARARGTARADAPTRSVPRLLRGAPGVVQEITATDAAHVQISSEPALRAAADRAGPSRAGHRARRGHRRRRPAGSAPGPFCSTEHRPGPGRRSTRIPATGGGGPARAALVFVARADDRARALADLDARTLDLWRPGRRASARGAGALAVPGWRIGYLALQTERSRSAAKASARRVAAALDPAARRRRWSPQAVAAAVVPAAGRVGASRRPAHPARARRDVARRLLGEAGLRARRSSVGLLVAARRCRGRRRARRGAPRRRSRPAGIALRLQPAPATRVSRSPRTASTRWC